MYSIGNDLNQYLSEDTLITKRYNYTSIKYDPTLTEERVNDIVEAAFGSIPILGEMNLGVPRAGEVEHIALFKTQDADGYFKLVEMQFNYGVFKTPSGDERAGPTYVELTVWKADWPNDPDFNLGSHIEKHRSSPWI